MMRDKLTRREDRALLRALREVVLNQFPNPDRKDCPGTPVLEAIAMKRISMFDPAHDHVGSCSPCFAELTKIRRRLHRRQFLLWAIGATGTAVLAVAVFFTYSRFHRVDNTVPHATVQTERPPESQPPAKTGEAVQPGTSPGVTPPQPKYDVALLDLRNASVSRTVEPGSNPKPIEIPRGLLALTVELPIGSDAGPYEVQIGQSDQQAIRTIKGQAVIENGIAKLLLHVDTRSIPSGEYDFSWRLADFSSRHHPILIR